MVDFVPVPVLVLLVALVLDMVVGDPRQGSRWLALHPVVWMGKFVAWWDGRIPRGSSNRERWLGALWAISTVLLSSLPMLVVPQASLLHPALPPLISAVLLKTTFTARGLARYAKDTLGVALQERRQRVARIVSRPTAGLSEDELRSATVESVAENITDSVVSPLVYYALFGLPGAFAYRAINTLDAMVGYRTERHRHVGWLAARMDAWANFLPEMLSAGLIQLVAVRRASVRSEGAERPARTIAAMASALDVRLEKRGHYRVHAARGPPREDDVRRAVRVMWAATAAFAVLLVGFLWLLEASGWRLSRLGLVP